MFVVKNILFWLLVVVIPGGLPILGLMVVVRRLLKNKRGRHERKTTKTSCIKPSKRH
jgi:hypothetical protein